MKTKHIALLNFADATKPAGQRFLGEAVVAMNNEQWTVLDAAKEASKLGINPGGTVIAYDCADVEKLTPYIGTLLNEEQAIALGLVKREQTVVNEQCCVCWS